MNTNQIVRKILLTVILGVGRILSGYSQMGIPDFHSNSAFEDSINYRVHQILPENRMFMIYLEESSYWFEKDFGKALILNKKGQWEVVSLLRDKNSKEFVLVSQRRLSRKRSEAANNLVNTLNQSPFLHLDVDSLNSHSQILVDTVINGEVLSRERFLSISDGISYRFEVLTGDNHRVIHAYEPRRSFKYFPIYWQKGVFINLLDQFNEIIEK